MTQQQLQWCIQPRIIRKTYLWQYVSGQF